VPFEEVELGRTVYRDGGSDYSINRTSCRLRDLLDLCRDTGLGANAYAIIENRMIDAILSDRAEERRGLFEEAAGIGRYKDRRKAALRRLERAELDLQRLDDVIGEVESKVRSLARQKGKAQRYHALRDRRLAVEMAVVRHQLDGLRTRLSQVEKELAGDRELGEGFLAELRAAEAHLETLRLRQAEVEQARREAASRVDEVRRELIRWERDLAVAGERSGYAKRRLAQLREEEQELAARIQASNREVETLRSAGEGLGKEMESLLAESTRRQEVASRARGVLEEARERLGASETALRDLTRRLAHLEGEAAAAEGQGAELERNLERLLGEMDETSHALSDAEAQGDLFTGEVQRLLEELRGRQAALQDAKDRRRSSREEMDGARRADTKALERLASLQARLEALEEMERSREGLEPTVKAALALGDPGVLGTLGDCLGGDPELMGAVESYLGPLVQGLVVQDREVVARLQRWHAEKWKGAGGLLLLPLDGLPDQVGAAKGSLLKRLKVAGPGAPWAHVLLGGVSFHGSGSSLDDESRGPFVSISGGAVDPQGVVRIGSPLGSSGLLARREEVHRLRTEMEEAEGLAADARAVRVEKETAAEVAEQAMEEAWRELREAEDAHRTAAAQVQAETDRRIRIDRHQENLARQIEGTRAALARARERTQTALEDRELLLEEAGRLRDEEEEARKAAEVAQEAWEEARSQESDLALVVARKEGDRGRLLERLSDLEASLQEANDRQAALAREREDLAGELAAADALREEGASATEALFGQRDEAEESLAQRVQAADRLAEALEEADRRVRVARTAERESLDRRHAQELEQQELMGRIGRLQDRLEGEWGRPLEVLLAEAEPVEGDPEELQEELEEILRSLDRIGLVNMLAVEEHQEESARLEFLMEQREDLRGARDDLRAAIRQINETATQLFRETFGKIRENFQLTFQRLFEGGEADLWLEDEGDPLESAVEIHASPRGKKTQRIDLLSGGERALTALSLLFGIYLVKPSPFCVMDEVDAPLDESNIYRFIKLLQEFKDQSQFIVITHNARTIEAADWIYGVTMEEPGVSRIVGVQLEDALQASGATG
jgi:chromosome segregation protein